LPAWAIPIASLNIRADHFSKREYMMGDHQRKVIQELLIDSSRTSRDGKELAT
jgi:hypothetical protein